MSFACPACGNTTSPKIRLQKVKSVYSSGLFFDIVECDNCSVYFNSPPVTESELDDFYKSMYGYVAHNLVHYEKLSRAKKLVKLSEIDWDGTIVGEIGTGAGELAKVLSPMIKSLDGCEIDEISARKVELENVRINIESAEIFLNRSGADAFNVVVMSHSLEHMHDPKKVLALVFSVLKDDGLLLLSVPNRSAAPKFLKKYWGYWQVPIHVCHFDIKSLTSLLTSVGFVVETENYRRSDFMAVGSFIANILGLSSTRNVPNGQLIKLLVSVLSRFYSMTYRFGKQDLIVVARK